jgi:hypothetical protein
MHAVNGRQFSGVWDSWSLVNAGVLDVNAFFKRVDQTTTRASQRRCSVVVAAGPAAARRRKQAWSSTASSAV